MTKLSGIAEAVRNFNQKHKIGVIPAHVSDKPDAGGLLDVMLPTIVGSPVLLAAYAAGGAPYFAGLLAATVGGFMLYGTRAQRNGYWLAEPKIAPTESLEIEHESNDKWWGQDVQDALDAHAIAAQVVAKDDTGATVDVYELEVAKGFDIGRVASLGNNFARALGLPKGQRVAVDENIGNGRAALYIPKSKRRAIKTSDLLEQSADQGKTIPGLIGESSVGQLLVIDVAKAPHMYVGGETGAGKSVTIINLILSATNALSPDKLKVTCIDPKRVELSMLNGLPHLIDTAITDMHKALARLEMLRMVMEQRYTEMEKAGVRNIEAYNRKFPNDIMPYHLLVIEELTLAIGNENPVSDDDKTPVGKAIESVLIDLAIAARAAGIHMIFGVQRFDAKTFDGQLRQNVPSVIGMKVKAAKSSEMLIGQSGCESLNGAGDCYVLMSGQNAPTRAQAAFATEEQIEQLVKQIRIKWHVKLQEQCAA